MSRTGSFATRLVGLALVAALAWVVAPAGPAASAAADDGVVTCITSGSAPSDRMPFQPACLPDLVVQALTVTQTANGADAAYETVVVKFTIKNQGGMPAGPFLVQVMVGATQRSLGAFTLKPGESYSGSASAIGAHGTIQTVSILIDPSNSVVESNRANKAKTIEIAVQ
jgi:hypothetical protein